MARKLSYFERRAAQNIWNTYNGTEKVHRELIKLYRDATDQVLSELYAIAAKCERDGVISRSEFYRGEHLKRLEEGLVSELQALGEHVERKGADTILNAGKDVVAASGELLGIPLSWNRESAIRILQHPWHGASFSDRVWNNQDRLLQTLKTTVTNGVLTGRPTAQVAVQMSRDMNVALSDCARLVRTETMHHLNQVNLRSMQETGVIQQVREVVTLDERTSDECAPHDGRIWDIDKAPVLPRHPNCRCVLVPHIDPDKIAAEFDREEARILFENGDIDEFEVAKRLGYHPLMGEQSVLTLRKEFESWRENLTAQEENSLRKYSGNGVDPDGVKLYQKINGYMRGTYTPPDTQETELIQRKVEEIESALLKGGFEHDMIVYRYQDPKFKFSNETSSFLSASCVSAPVMGNNIPNIEIIVPKGTLGAYIEALSEYPEQKEILLLDGTRFKMIAETAEKKLFEVIK